MEEDNFFGKTTPQEPSPERMLATFFDNPKTGIKVMDWQVSSSGYAAVWAKENTRASLWDAMQRRETYATTGPRMIVRFFGGWDFAAQDANSRLPAQTGYTKGVPMGGDLRAAPQGKSPTLPGGGAEGSDRREPRPLPDRQGLARPGTASSKRRSMTSPGPMPSGASPAPTASCLRSATPSTWRTPPGRTRSARPSW